MQMLFVLFVLMTVAVPSMAQNNSYIIQQPGQVPTYIDRSPTGGYTIQTPGQDTLYMDRRPGGSVIIQNPSNLNSPPLYIDQQQRRSRY